MHLLPVCVFLLLSSSCLCERSKSSSVGVEKSKKSGRGAELVEWPPLGNIEVSEGSMSPTKMESLKASGAAGDRLVKIDLSNCQFEDGDFPEVMEEVLKHRATLELLNLGGNNLSALPDSMVELKCLRILFFAGNKFESVPEVLGKLENLYMLSFKGCNLKSISETALTPSIEWLILTDNSLTQLPKAVGNLLGLKKCMLAGNQLSHLPDEMSACKKIELIRISSNNLSELPQWLISLPRLSWIAFASNPFCLTGSSGDSKEAPLESVDYADLEMQEVLGQGASGEVYKAIWKGQEVAVKMFKGAATSDGLPEDEVAAGIKLGQHTNTIELLAKVKGVPHGRLAVLLPLIPPSFDTLGNPPSFDTCTRDTYPEGTTFDPRGAVSILRAIADICAHMHASGLSHGDLYAHNILVDPSSRDAPLTKLTDFGAASVLSGLTAAQVQHMERIEVRAVGCLMEELGQRLDGEGSAEMAAKLEALAATCTDEDTLSRPSFAALHSSLGSLLSEE